MRTSADRYRTPSVSPNVPRDASVRPKAITEPKWVKKALNVRPPKLVEHFDANPPRSQQR